MFVLKGERDPHGLDEAEQPLQILLNAVLSRPFSLTDGRLDSTDVLLEYLDALDQDSDLLSAWQRTSFYEWIIPRLQEKESAGFQTTRELFSALFRSNKEVSHAAVDISNFTPLPAQKSIFLLFEFL